MMMMSNDDNTKFNISDYLVTEAIDPRNIDQGKINSDLEALNKAEEKTTYKTNIAKGIKNTKVQRAVSALKLTNPFKGY